MYTVFKDICQCYYKIKTCYYLVCIDYLKPVRTSNKNLLLSFYGDGIKY